MEVPRPGRLLRMLQSSAPAGPKKLVTGLRFRHAQAALLAHDWPGNVRELEHLVGRSALKALAGMSGRPRILSLTASHLDLPTPASWGAPALDAPGNKDATALGIPGANGAAPPVDLRTSMELHQRQRIEASLAQHHNNWASAASELGLHRANLVRLAKRLGLRGEAGSPPDRLRRAVQNPPKQGV